MKKILLMLTVAATALSGGAVKLVNNKQYLVLPLAAGQNAELKHFMTAATDGTLSLEDSFTDDAVWLWTYVSGTATVDGHYVLKNVATGKYLFEENAAGDAVLTDADVALTKSDSPVTDAAVTLAANGKYLAVSEAGAVTVSADNAATTSAFVMMEYVASQTAEEIESAAANAVAVAYGIPDAVNQLRPMLLASYTGTRQVDRVLNVLYYSETPADISTQLVEVRRTAVRMFETDFENGVTWQQKSTDLYVTAAADGTFTGAASSSVNGIWFGHFTDNGNTKVEGREFRLYNNATKEYLVLTDGAFSTTATQTDGTLWTVAYFYGQGLAIKPASSETDDQLLYLGADRTLTVGSDVESALTYAGEIAMFGEGINSVKPVGTATVEDGVTVYSDINAIELVLQHGATPAADGTLTLTYYYDEETTTLEVIPATDIKDPVSKTIDLDYYDSTGTHITGTAEVDVYTLPLSATYVDGGQYMVRVNMGAFELDGALSREMAGYYDLAVSNTWEPIVTPAAGNVAALTEITITGANGIYPNPKYSNMATVDINCDGETLQMFFRDDFVEGGAYDSYDINDPSKPWFTIPVDYTADGRYSLYIEPAFFVDNDGAPCSAFSVVWEIESDAIKNVRIESRADAPTYDLLGRPATRGLLISNGRKTYVK